MLNLSQQAYKVSYLNLCRTFFSKILGMVDPEFALHLGFHNRLRTCRLRSRINENGSSPIYNKKIISFHKILNLRGTTSSRFISRNPHPLNACMCSSNSHNQGLARGNLSKVIKDVAYFIVSGFFHEKKALCPGN